MVSLTFVFNEERVAAAGKTVDELLQPMRDWAAQKGIQESLVVVDELAFIVNIPNKTVITAMDRSDTADNVFTNIDGAVFM